MKVIAVLFAILHAKLPRIVHHHRSARPVMKFEQNDFSSEDFTYEWTDTTIKDAWVLIFNQGKKNEGVYTISKSERSSILAFESVSDATRFAHVLAASNFHLASCVKWKALQISIFCELNNFNVTILPPGALFTPPDTNEFTLSDDFRDRLELLFPQEPDNCSDDDCTSSY